MASGQISIFSSALPIKTGFLSPFLGMAFLLPFLKGTGVQVNVKGWFALVPWNFVSLWDLCSQISTVNQAAGQYQFLNCEKQ